jgi:NADH:ubiquinone oxidoreductase subunit C
MHFKNILLFCPKYIEKVIVNTSNVLTIFTNLDSCFKLILFLKNSTFFKYQILTDIVCVDYGRVNKRFKLTYILTSIKYNNRIYISTYLNENNYPQSIEHLYSVAN